VRSALLVVMCLALTACATPRQCVAWDYSQPIQVAVPAGYGIVVQRTVYPCTREQ